MSLLARSAWPNFADRELACRHCGRLHIDTAAGDALQALRDELGGGLVVLSAYRCPVHNAAVGGAPLSQHKLGTAFDLALRSPGLRRHGRFGEPAELLALGRRAAELVGFTGFGGYRTFLHVDIGAKREWGQWNF